MKNILMIGLALMAGYTEFALLAQEPVQFTPQATVVAKAYKPVTGAPFSAVAVTESVQTLADGNRLVKNDQKKLYRDSQGRERSEVGGRFWVVGEQVDVARIVAISDPAAGWRYSLNLKALTAMKTALGNVADFQPSRTTSRLQGVKEQLPPAVIEGVYAQGTRLTQTTPPGSIFGNERDLVIVDEVWYSPDLQMDVMRMHSDPRSGVETYRLTNIDRSEPDPALFQIPAGYKVTDSVNSAPTIYRLDPPPPPPAK